MKARSMMLFGSKGYVGGSIAAMAKAQGQEVYEFHSTDFPFWGNVSAWPWDRLKVPVDCAILAASFEQPVIEGRSIELLIDRFRVLVSNLKAKRLIFLSTDAVFDGSKGPYSEQASTVPLTPYGRAKVAMERALPRATGYIVRTSIVWGAGTTKPDARRARFLAEPERPFKGATNVFRSPISLVSLTQAVLRLTHEKEPPSLIHLHTTRKSYYEFMHDHLLYDHRDELKRWIDRRYGTHDTSLTTQYHDLVRRLLL